MPSGAHRRAGRTALVLLQLLVFVFYAFGPTGTLAEEPVADPTPTESAAPAASGDPEPTASAEPSEAPSEAPAPPASTAPEPSQAPDPPAAPGTEPYVISFAAGTSESRQLEVLATAGVTDASAIPQLAMRSILLHPDVAAYELAALRGMADVVRVEADRTRDVEAAPSDTSYADQWSLPQVGWDQLYGTVGIAGSATVAILDTGIDGAHPDLDGVVLPGHSVLDGSNGLSDPNGHGTWMAGIVAAETDNGIGIAGTAYAGVSVLPVTVLGADGTGQDSDIIAGVVYAADAGADVILMSFSNPGFSAALQAAIDYAWAAGAVLVAATGNDGSSTATFPAGDRGVIGVGATDPSDLLAASSNFGAATFMVAPGLAITTTAAGGDLASISGTSAAAASVAGAAALLSANEPSLSNGVIVGRLARTADPAGDPAATGNGRLNLLRAMGDAATDAVQPAGAAPVGDGGPLVGPYFAATRGWSVNNVSVTEGDSGTVNANFTLTLNGNGSEPAPYTVQYSTSNGTASGGASCVTGVDYIATSGTASLNANGTVAVAVPVCGDSLDEANIETFELVLSNPTNSNASGANASGDGNVNDNDPLPTLSIDNVSLNEGNAGTTSFTFAVTLSAPSGRTVTVNRQTANSSAAAPSDFTALGSATITFAPGDTSEPVVVLVNGDAAVEPNETFFVNLSNANNATIADSQGAGTILNDDAANTPPTVDVTGAAAVNEGSATTYSFTTTDAQGGPFTLVSQSCGIGTLSAPTFNASTGAGSFVCTFADGPASATVSVQVKDSANANSNVDGISVTVNNVAPTATFNAPPSVNEGSAIAISLTSPLDASSVDTTAGFTYAFDCGSGYGVFSATTSTSCSTNDNGSRTVKGQIRDKDGGVTEYTASVTINNVAPTATFNAPASVNEGSAIAISLASPLDASSVDATAGFTYAFDCGSGYGAFSATSSASCSTNDNGSRTVKGQIQDKDGGVTEYTASVTINNVAPIATFTNDGPVAEGSTATVTFSDQSDPSTVDTTAGFTYSYDFDNDGTFEITGSSSASATVPASYLDDGPGTRTVKGRITDKDGGSTNYTTNVTITNVDPTATFGNGGSVTEGSTGSVSFSGEFDPSTADSTAGFTYSYDYDNDGTFEATDTLLATAIVPASYLDDGPGSLTVRGRISDDDGGFTDYTTTITITNVAPTGTFGAPGSVPEGTSIGLTLSSVFDPSTADTTAGFTYAFDCGSGYGAFSGTSSESCPTNDNGSRTVKGKVQDKDGGITEYTASVSIGSVAPTATFGNNGPVYEGNPATLSLTVPFDPSSVDTTAGFRHSFACDGVLGSLIGSYALASASNTQMCTYDDNGSYGVIGRILDKDNASTTYGGSVVVLNVAPTPDIAGEPATSPEGTLISLTGSATDPSAADTTAGFTFAWSVTKDAVAYASGSGSAFSFTPDDNASYVVTLDATDKDGGTGTTSVTIAVTNVAPTPDIAGEPATSPEGTLISLTGSASDPSSVDTAAGFDFDWSVTKNAAPYSTGTGSSFAFTPNDNGTYVVTLGATDKDLETGTTSVTIVATNVAPSVPNLIDPAIDAITNDATPTFDWTDSTDPAGPNDTITYAIQADNSGCAFPSPEVDTTGIATSTYTPAANLADGVYCWRVRASDEDGGISSYSSTRNVRVDVTAPAVGITFPVNSGTYSEASWDAGCASVFGDACGTASDGGSGLQSIEISIRRGSGNWWNPVSMSFSSATETWMSLGTTSPWNKAFSFANFPASGSYVLHARATDNATNQGDATSTFTINRYTLDYQPPIDDSTNALVLINTGKNGRVIPVKVKVYLDSAIQTSSQIAEGRLTINTNPVVCGSNVANDAVELYADAGNSNAGTNQFRASGDSWIYNLDTRALGLTSGKCYRLDVYLDGVRISTQQFAIFQPVK